MSFRSLLYVPANNARALEKAHLLSQGGFSDGQARPDGLILDLEDAVPPEQKDLARQQARAALRRGFGVPVLVRVNGLGTPWEHPDREMALTERVAGLVLPKAEAPALGELYLGAALWPTIETPLGVLNAPALAALPGVAGLLVGSNDLALGLGAKPGAQRQELQYALQAVVLAARAYGKAVLDGVYNNFRDPKGLAAECQQGRALGFDGKTLIHPAQIETANRCFGVSEAEAQAARALLEAWQAASGQAGWQGVLNYGGQMIEELHLRQAQALLERYQAQRP